MLKAVDRMVVMVKDRGPVNSAKLVLNPDPALPHAPDSGAHHYLYVFLYLIGLSYHQIHHQKAPGKPELGELQAFTSHWCHELYGFDQRQSHPAAT